MDNLAEKGALLKRARLAKGISHEMVHDATKIPIDALKALEEGYSIRSMTPFYQRGFLKMYAQYLNVDLTAIVGERKPSAIRSPILPEEKEEIVEDVHVPPPPPPVPPKTISRERNKIPQRPVPEKSPEPPVPSEINFRQIFDEILTPERIGWILKTIGILILAFILFKVAGCAIHKISEQARRPKVIKSLPKEEKKPKEKAPKPAAAAETPVVAPVAAPAVVEKTAPAPAPVLVVPKVEEVKKVEAQVEPVTEDSTKPSEAVKAVTLSARAKKNSWLQVKADGIIVFQSVLKKGVTESWYADRDIELSGKNINQLEFEVNGKMLGALGRDESRAKKVIINKNGLSVKK